MAWILLPVALAAGVVLPVQFGVNGQLRTYGGGPLAAAAISFVVGAVALAVAALAVQRSLPGSVASAPWWAWTGGLLGAFFVLASIILTPRLGAATTIGLIRVPVHEASFPRIIGALLIVAGVVMLQRF
jgi:transporter family-2 protein